MNTSETGLEKIIVSWLTDNNGYEQENPHALNKEFANSVQFYPAATGEKSKRFRFCGCSVRPVCP